jgi:hypothetical protein
VTNYFIVGRSLHPRILTKNCGEVVDRLQPIEQTLPVLPEHRRRVARDRLNSGLQFVLVKLLPESAADSHRATLAESHGAFVLGVHLRKQGRRVVTNPVEFSGRWLRTMASDHAARPRERANDPATPTVIVIVRTDAMPPVFAEVNVQGVAWTYSDKQEQVVGVLHEVDRPLTAREVPTAPTFPNGRFSGR